MKEFWKGKGDKIVALLLGWAGGRLFQRATHSEDAHVSLQEELGLAQMRLQAAVDSSLDAIITANRESVITDWSRQAEHMFGWSREEAIGRRLTDTIIPPAYRARHEMGVKRFLETGVGPIINKRIQVSALHKGGREFPVELTVATARRGRHLIFTAFIRDLTEQKKAEAYLAAEHSITRVLAESHRLEEAAPRVLEVVCEQLGWELGIFWALDNDAKRLRFVAEGGGDTQKFSEFLLRNRDESFVRGKGLPGRVWEVLSPIWIEDVQKEPNFPRETIARMVGLRSAFAFPVLSGKNFLGVVECFEQEVRPRDEALLQTMEIIGADLAQSLRRIQAEEGRDEARRQLEIANNDLLKTNRELEERSHEAEHASQVKSEFLASMSHELRTPINAILGYDELLAMGIAGELNKEQLSYLSRIRFSTKHLLVLVEDILDFAKMESGRLKIESTAVDIEDSLHAALALVDTLAKERNIRVKEISIPEEKIEAQGDGGRIRQILINLLTNAVKFTEPGGSIRMRVRKVRDDENSPAPTLPWVLIEVEDTGIGIAPEAQEEVFEPFVQGESGYTRSATGTGLGLAIGRRLARMMGGDLSVRSEIGKGSCFSLWLPPAGWRNLILQGDEQNLPAPL